jgi:hypothetical protein
MSSCCWFSTKKLVHAMVTSCLNYNRMLFCLPRMQNTVKLISLTRMREHNAGVKILDGAYDTPFVSTLARGVGVWRARVTWKSWWNIWIALAVSFIEWTLEWGSLYRLACLLACLLCSNKLSSNQSAVPMYNEFTHRTNPSNGSWNVIGCIRSVSLLPFYTQCLQLTPALTK